MIETEDPIVLITCGDCYHALGHSRLVYHTASRGVPHENHWYVPRSVALRRGYIPCKVCHGLTSAAEAGRDTIQQAGASGLEQFLSAGGGATHTDK